MSRRQWTAAEALAWYAGQPWHVGCNFIPSTAVNQLEMWQAESFDPATIDRELGWATALGFNAIRVYLHDLPWKADASGFFHRIDHVLAIAEAHAIRTMLVLFDGVWDPHPKSGPQASPRPHLHNPGWVQSPGGEILGDPARHDELEAYVTAVISRFADDKRVLVWDIFNEPDNPNPAYGRTEISDKAAMALALLSKAYGWARAVGPAQPITSAV